MDDLNEQRALSDMYLVSALVAYGIRPVRIDRSNPRRQKFIFNLDVDVPVFVGNSDRCELSTLNVDEIETHYMVRSLFLPPNYVDALREIRATVHSYAEDSNYGY